ncbi:UDP-2,4-diacetamido-2,4,6-trideoxy-beta-L-altropyranose hydrolase [uncultured Aquimarina sp.]|uniref:UDP-2,4-diacetamido-2,4, 6-trideoxy-beta-L-altropyranose hydrolase n=1 Tax=uncultured Aquimarina sp. TaxID=575652 RepID=UPI00261A78FE|nr:UDP-2,4-diacetamido-2,4,6-trideoxy-beta-L-altropyranose hydrolase [uncultured Aquimarina sp.]
MKKRILFRADGNKATGLGHLYRLFAVVEMLKDHFDCMYLTRTSSTIKVIPEEYNLKLIDNNISIQEEPSWLAKQFKPEESIIIADGYQFDSSYQKLIKALQFTLVYIDDLAKEHMHADLVINHSPAINIADFRDSGYTNYALGTKYALLRPSFLAAAKEERIIERVEKAFVCFGGADKLNLSLKTVKALLQIGQIQEIHIVLGAAYKYKDIYELAEQHLSRVYLHFNLSEEELISLMRSCNFAVAPTSTILYELCCVKMPILGGYFVDNQKLIYKGFKEKAAIFPAGDFTNWEITDFKKSINRILKRKSYDYNLNAQKELFDSKINERFITRIKELC